MKKMGVSSNLEGVALNICFGLRPQTPQARGALEATASPSPNLKNHVTGLVSSRCKIFVLDYIIHSVKYTL